MTARLVEVRFGLDSSDWHGHAGESLWAAPVNNTERGSFRILNSPFFTRGINHHDVVQATSSGDKMVLEFEQVVERSGHSTYMLIIDADTPKFHTFWNTLEAKGCSYESMHINLSMGRRLLLSVDVRPSANLFEVYDIIERGESDGVWLFQEGHISA